MSAGPAVGPVLGGAIIDAYGWRVTLGCIVPLALAVLLCGVFFARKRRRSKAPQTRCRINRAFHHRIRWPALRILERLDTWLDEHRSARHYYCGHRMPYRIRQTPAYARGAAARFALPEIERLRRCRHRGDAHQRGVPRHQHPAPHSAPNGHGRIGARNGHCHAARGCSRHSHQPLSRVSYSTSSARARFPWEASCL